MLNLLTNAAPSVAAPATPNNAIDRNFFMSNLGALTPQQIASLNLIFDYWENPVDLPGVALTDLRWLAYIFATLYGETGIGVEKWMPIEEYGKGKGREYGKPDPVTGKIYYGRGYVQITWATNYKRLGTRLGLGMSLYNNPELALDPKTAVRILFVGMVEGLFTDLKLSNYFNAKTEDYNNAREIINGQDRAAELGAKGIQYRSWLRLAVPVALPADGSLISSTDGNPTIYCVDKGQKRMILDEFTFAQRGWQTSQIKKVTPAILNALPTGANIVPADGTILVAAYVMKGEKKCPIPTETVFNKSGLNWANRNLVSQSTVDGITTGVPLV
ncbi:MAG: hypothetical protein RLZZ628_4254 [Bacteroidota bacterium]|jgi:hypothetical protein